MRPVDAGDDAWLGALKAELAIEARLDDAGPGRLYRGHVDGAPRTFSVWARDPALEPVLRRAAQLTRSLALHALVQVEAERETEQFLIWVLPPLDDSIETCLAEDRFFPGPLELRQAAARPALLELASYLRALHHHGGSDRDLRPGKLFLEAGHVKVLDRGTLTDERSAPASHNGVNGYVAFEQFDGRGETKSDIYAFAATAVQLLTGIAPKDLPRKKMAPDLSALTLPSDLRPLLARCLALEPAERPSAAELCAALELRTESAPELVLESAAEAPKAARRRTSSRRTSPANRTAAEAIEAARPGETKRLEELWQRVLDDLADEARHRAFIQYAVEMELYLLAVVRFDALAEETPEHALLAERSKERIAQMAAARILARQAAQRPDLAPAAWVRYRWAFSVVGVLLFFVSIQVQPSWRWVLIFVSLVLIAAGIPLRKSPASRSST